MNGYAAGQAMVTALRNMKEPPRASLMQGIDGLKGATGHAVSEAGELNSGLDGRRIFGYQISQVDGTSWQPVGNMLHAVKLGLVR